MRILVDAARFLHRISRSAILRGQLEHRRPGRLRQHLADRTFRLANAWTGDVAWVRVRLTTPRLHRNDFGEGGWLIACSRPFVLAVRVWFLPPEPGSGPSRVPAEGRN